jgi:MFS family permease
MATFSEKDELHQHTKGEISHSEGHYSPDPYHERPEDLEDHRSRQVDIDHGFDPHEINTTVRKVDLRLIPILSAMYCISLIDRTNLSLARAANKLQMNIDLDLAKADGSSQGNRYGLATIMFFIPYIILEVPSQLGLRKFGAKWWLGTATVLWGIVMIGMGFVTNWQSLVALRAVLGIFESCLFPGAAFLISCWYPRHQMAMRNSFFYCLSIVLSGLSSIMAWGISQLHTRNNLHGWQWIFIIQGALTVFIGFMGYLFITDFPDKAHFLTDHQKNIIITRIQRDRGDAEVDKLTMPLFWEYLFDFKLWLFGFFFGSTTLGSYSLAYFLPGILAQMGFSNALAQILVAPPYVWCIVPCVAVSMFSDKTRMRAAGISFNAICLIVGTCMYSQLPIGQKAARYTGIFLAIGGCNSNVPLILAWAQSSIRRQSKRGFASALIVAWGGVGGILSGVVFMEKEAKKGYPTGVYLTLALNSCVVLFSMALMLYFKWMNRRADRGLTVIEGSPAFRYQG